MELISREEAKRLGLKTYFTGKSCKKGHLAIRYTVNSHCKECQFTRALDWAKKNPEKKVAATLKWQQKNPDAKSRSNKNYYEKHKDRVLENTNTWKKENLEKCRAHNAKRRAAKLQRIPSWAELETIKKFYEDCPEGYVVDHIIPLQGKTVSGLHVIDNLQYLTLSENSSKGNSFRP